MRILSIDTASKSCSVAVTHNESVLAELTIDTQETHAKHLLGMIDAALDHSKLKLSQIDGFAVTRGPGSFTGLRIGLATIKGLASASEKPIVGVSTLEALALQAACPDRIICPFLDARRGEIYHARYCLIKGSLSPLIEEKVALPEEAIAGIDGPSLFVGNGAVLYREIIQKTMGSIADFALPTQHTLRASTVSQIASGRFASGDTDDTGQFIPVYIRKSDAEINRGGN